MGTIAVNVMFTKRGQSKIVRTRHTACMHLTTLNGSSTEPTSGYVELSSRSEKFGRKNSHLRSRRLGAESLAARVGPFHRRLRPEALADWEWMVGDTSGVYRSGLRLDADAVIDRRLNPLRAAKVTLLKFKVDAYRSRHFELMPSKHRAANDRSSTSAHLPTRLAPAPGCKHFEPEPPHVL